MSLTVSADLLLATTHPELRPDRKCAQSARVAREYAIDVARLGEDGLADLIQAAKQVKMLFRLALRVAKNHREALTLDVFRRCAMFRAIKMAA